MEQLEVRGRICPRIVEKAAQALTEGHRRAIKGTAKAFYQINVGYRYRLLLKGDGKALLLTHEQMNRYLSSQPKRSKK